MALRLVQFTKVKHTKSQLFCTDGAYVTAGIAERSERDRHLNMKEKYFLMGRSEAGKTSLTQAFKRRKTSLCKNAVYEYG